jgi:hypothetical protein
MVVRVEPRAGLARQIRQTRPTSARIPIVGCGGRHSGSVSRWLRLIFSWTPLGAFRASGVGGVFCPIARQRVRVAGRRG